MSYKYELKKLYIVGAGGFGRETAWLVDRINAVTPSWDFQGFIDDDQSLWETEADGYKICGGYDYLEKQNQALWIVIAIGNPKARKRVYEILKPFAHIRFASLLDPSVALSSFVSIGEGSIICAGSIITVDVEIGRHNIINLDCTIGHDAVTEDFVTLYPSVNISGGVKVGAAAEIGTGTQVIQGVSIGSGAVIGAGTVVNKDIEPEVTAVGCPARIIKRHECSFCTKILQKSNVRESEAGRL